MLAQCVQGLVFNPQLEICHWSSGFTENIPEVPRLFQGFFRTPEQQASYVQADNGGNSKIIYNNGCCESQKQYKKYTVLNEIRHPYTQRWVVQVPGYYHQYFTNWNCTQQSSQPGCCKSQSSIVTVVVWKEWSGVSVEMELEDLKLPNSCCMCLNNCP